MKPLPYAQYTSAALLYTAAGLLALLPLGPVLRGLLAAAYFLGHGQRLGCAVTPREPRSWRLFFGSLAFGLIFLFGGCVFFYLYKLNWLASLLLVALAPLAAARLFKTTGSAATPPETEMHATRERTWPAQLLAATVIGLLLLAAGRLLPTSILEPTRTPWDSVPPDFFVLIFTASLGLFALAVWGRSGRPLLAAVMLAGLLLTGVAAFTYRIGFGFDPFIHQATEKIILETGTIEPKPPYYAGQYALVVLLARLTGAAVADLDRFLVPLLVPIAVLAAYWSLRRTGAQSTAAAAVGTTAFLFLPLGSFIMTTPQGLANGLVLLTAWLALPTAAGADRTLPPRLFALLGAAALLTHPLAGVLLAVFLGLLHLGTARKHGRFKRSAGLAVLILAGSIALPALFLLNGWLSSADIAFNSDLLRSPAQIVEKLREPNLVTRRFNALLDVVYFWRAAQDHILLGAIAAGFWLLRSGGRIAAVYGLAAGVCLLNYLLLKVLVDFRFLIDYERANYADRIPELTLLLLAPLLSVAFIALLACLRGLRRLPLAGTAVLLLAVFAASNLYLTYPRRDSYETSAGWSTGAADVEAVRQINADANGRPYAVLANQSVAAAAIREFGFSRYFDAQDPARPGKIFYYPVPTGDRLYQEFLAMNESGGSAETARRVQVLTGADTVYYIVNHYWTGARSLITSARRAADSSWSVDNQVFVFKYIQNNR